MTNLSSVRNTLLKSLYDTAIDKSIDYMTAESAVNRATATINSLPHMSETTMQIAMILAKEALERVADKSLYYKQCQFIIEKQFRLTLVERQDIDANLPQAAPITFQDLVDIELTYTPDYF